MYNYQDRETGWHDKMVIDGEPSSNNSWIYSAYSRYLAPNTTDRHKLISRYAKCKRSANPLKIDRLPGKKEPLFSKDEVIGCVSLGLLSDGELSESHYNFCNADEDFERKLSLKSIYKAVKALYKIRNEHRNYVWKNKVLDAYPLAFRLPNWDIYYVQKMGGKSPSLVNTTLFYLNFLSIYIKGDKSSRMMIWLQLNDLDNPLKRILPYKRWVKDYFEDTHPFVRRLK